MTNDVEQIILERLKSIEVKMDDGFSSLWGSWHELNTKVEMRIDPLRQDALCKVNHEELKTEVREEILSALKTDKSIKNGFINDFSVALTKGKSLVIWLIILMVVGFLLGYNTIQQSELRTRIMNLQSLTQRNHIELKNGQ